MSDLLMVIALLLMIVSALAAWNYGGSDEVEMEAMAAEPKHAILHKTLGVGGIVVALGGFWADWMLWLGLILIELGCIAYFAGSRRCVKADDESNVPPK